MRQGNLQKRTARFLSGLMVVSLCACSAETPAMAGSLPGESAHVGTYTEAIAEDYSYKNNYQSIEENGFIQAEDAYVPTVPLKVDTASYANVASYIEDGAAPPPDAVRTEELINYFPYEEEVEMIDGTPFGVYTEVGPSVFDKDMMMAFVRVKTTGLDKSELPASNLVFLIDASASMNYGDRTLDPLLTTSLKLLVEELDENDRVSIVVFYHACEVVLDGVSGADKAAILRALEEIESSGNTGAEKGLATAYTLAEKNFIPGGNNRILLCTDGMFSDSGSLSKQLEEIVTAKRAGGVCLTVLGFGGLYGYGLDDEALEILAAAGNGSYHYINNIHTAKTVLVEQMGANLFAVAHDARVRVTFDPYCVERYRLIGYENSLVANTSLRGGSTGGAVVGAGADILLLFEFEPYARLDTGSPQSFFSVDIQYKEPGATKDRTLCVDEAIEAGAGSTDFWFASAVAAFGHLLRGSDYTGKVRLVDVAQLARENLGRDPGGHRYGFFSLLEQSRYLL